MFIEGDLIECLNDGNGTLWMGRLRRDRRAVGLFPHGFVELLPESQWPVIPPSQSWTGPHAPLPPLPKRVLQEKTSFTHIYNSGRPSPAAALREGLKESDAKTMLSSRTDIQRRTKSFSTLEHASPPESSPSPFLGNPDLVELLSERHWPSKEPSYLDESYDTASSDETTTDLGALTSRGKSHLEDDSLDTTDANIEHGVKMRDNRGKSRYHGEDDKSIRNVSSEDHPDTSTDSQEIEESVPIPARSDESGPLQFPNFTSTSSSSDDGTSASSTSTSAASAFTTSTKYSATTIDTEFMEEGIASAIQQFVEILCADEFLKPLYEEAIKSKAIGARRFSRNFRRLLKIYSKELKYDAVDGLQDLAAQLLIRWKAKEVAERIADKHMKGVNHVSLEDGHERIIKRQKESNPKQENSDNEVPPIFREICIQGLGSVRGFLVDGIAFEQLKLNFELFVRTNVRADGRTDEFENAMETSSPDGTPSDLPPPLRPPPSEPSPNAPPQNALPPEMSASVTARQSLLMEVFVGVGILERPLRPGMKRFHWRCVSAYIGYAKNSWLSIVVALNGTDYF